MMLGIPTYRLEFTEIKPVWVFPVDRFTTYEVKDERWARVLRYGREEPRRVTTVIPAGVILESGLDGITFKAIGPLQTKTEMI